MNFSVVQRYWVLTQLHVVWKLSTFFRVFSEFGRGVLVNPLFVFIEFGRGVLVNPLFVFIEFGRGASVNCICVLTEFGWVALVDHC